MLQTHLSGGLEPFFFEKNTSKKLQLEIKIKVDLTRGIEPRTPLPQSGVIPLSPSQKDGMEASNSRLHAGDVPS